MKTKIIIVSVILIIISSSVMPVFGYENYTDNFESKSSLNELEYEEVVIRVAIYVKYEVGSYEKFYSPTGRTGYFKRMLDDYKWTVGNKCYSFLATLLTDEQLFKGELTTDNFDVFLYPPGTADTYYLETGYHRLPENELRVKLIKDFVKDGGGYFGTCGGAGIACTSDSRVMKAPIGLLLVNSGNLLYRFYSRMWLTSCMGISCIKNHGTEKWYDSVGLYFFYSGLRNSSMPLTYKPDMNFNDLAEVCLDLPVNKDHAIFDDFLEDTRRVRWACPANFEIPDNPGRQIDVLLSYPAEEISDNESTQIHVWEYTGGLRGMINAAKLGRNGLRDWINRFRSLKLDIMAHASDWRKTDQIVETNFANKSFMTAEIYPNENEARIVLCVGHPEYRVWWGGHIEEVPDNDNNSLFSGFYRWVNVTPEEETIEDEWTYNWWIVLRSIAWASKLLPENDLPPVYGKSQVCDFEQNMSSSEFTVYGNSEADNGNVSLELYYSYSSDGIDWTNYSLYDTDDDVSDGISWEFNSPDGAGHYQFYSIRNLDYEGYIETERVPPGADSTVFVETD